MTVRGREREGVCVCVCVHACVQRVAAEVQLVPRRNVPMAERALLLQNASAIISGF